ncbi:uncharacterized protein LOC133336668, partial [Musca vetustissima]|uniref:uncharacterized protein LOC133336668 n=1 Tax=Musca vetustissima TaxID=27455 RepID=UPI002AB75278
MFRIQKLMMEEYEEIYEPVIVENPFTQVTEDGIGLRQFHIGLTRSKLLFGCDDFDKSDLQKVHGTTKDPEIETFELVSMLPLQFVKLNFFRKQKRELMRIIVCDEEEAQPMFFEFGGHLYKNLFWNTWRERISTIRLSHPNLMHINGSSPFSSTDVLAEEELCHALVHTRSMYSLGGDGSMSLCP